MSAMPEELVQTLLYENYALYPYTPGSPKNATPTPFGIVYPAAYAQNTSGAFERLRMQGVLEARSSARIAAEVRFLQAAGEGHRAVERRIDVEPRSLGELAAAPITQPFSVDGLEGRLRVSAQRLSDDLLAAALWRVALCVHNTTSVDGGLDRSGALRHSLLSTHPLVHVSGGRFVSPLERDGDLGDAVAACESVNTYPVLATPSDDVLLGATIALPDHPQIAPESRGDLFDGTEIEEALLLHVMTLSDGEREDIARQDPALRAMLERATAATPEDLLALHGRTTISEPEART